MAENPSKTASRPPNRYGAEARVCGKHGKDERNLRRDILLILGRDGDGLETSGHRVSQEMFLLLDRGSQFAFGGLLCLKYCPVVITAAHSNGVPSRHSNSARDTRHTTQNGGNGSGKAIHFQDFSSTTIP
jgi:hypothetical protein